MKQPLTVGSLFSGIGGLDMGFERAGFEIRWMCEIDPFCRKVLRKHWPEVPIYEDVRSIRGSAKEEEEYVSNADEGRRRTAQQVLHAGQSHAQGCRVVEPIDVLIGGFPCQDISLAGKGAGLDGSRSGLWWEFYRLIGELRPRYVVLENIAALVVRGLPEILGALSTLGYDAEWQIVSAASLGAPHLRERLFVVAYPQSERSREERGFRFNQPSQRASCRCQDVAYPNQFNDDHRGCRTGTVRGKRPSASGLRNGKQDVADAPGARRRSKGSTGEAIQQTGAVERLAGCTSGEWQYWAVEPSVGRVATGIPRRVDRLRALGNSVVPQVAEYIARCIAVHAEATP
ncbi:MAG: DNA cytosine methyltransferase [Rhodothermales bacterium]